MQLKTILLLIISLSLSHPSKGWLANEYVLTELPTQQQLPVANVHCIYQDREGFIWYGTRGGGLCRDNGYHIDVFRSDRNHPDLIGASNDITSLAGDFHNHILFSTKEGLYMLDKNDYTIHVVDQQLAGKSAGPILVASDSTVWVCSSKQVYHYDQHLHLMATIPSKWKGQDAWASRIMQDSRGRIWVTQWNGGVVMYNRAARRFEEQYWEESIPPADLVEDPTGHGFWIGTWGKGIMHYDPDHRRATTFPSTYGDANTSLTIHLVGDTSSPRLWASTMYGLRAYDIIDGSLHPVSLGGILPEGMSVIDNTAFDNNGNLWVSGFSPHTFILSHPDTSIMKADLSSIRKQLHNRPFIRNTVKEGDNIWLGQDREPIALYLPKAGTIAFDKNVSTISRPSVTDFCKRQDEQGIWGKEQNLLYHLWYDGHTVQSRVETKARGNINCILDAGGGEVYIGHQEGIDLYHATTHTATRIPVSAKRVVAILKARDGNLYYASDDSRLDALAADVCMSRSALYRKLHSLTGQKPSLFIRAIRLKHAARMIKEGSYNLTEISTLCGFSSPSYFSRCFKAQYSVPPGSYCSS